MSLLQEITERTASLYTLPEVALDVLELTSHPRVDVPALKACIERDPALTCKILKVVNSSMFGLSRSVADLTQALSLLGVKPLKMLVLGFSLPKDLSSDIETLSLSHYWRHALVKAVACRELAERYWKLPGDEAFIAGLLQDIGQLVLLQHLGEPYQKFLQQSYTTNEPLADLEIEALGFDHAIVSSRILEKWALPKTLVQAVAVPHNADRIDHLPLPERPLPQLLHMGELIAKLLIRRPEGTLPELLVAAERYKHLNYESIRELIQGLEEKVTALGEVLNLYQPDATPFGEILAQAHLRLAAVAEDVSYDLATTANDVLQETHELTRELKSAVANSALAAPLSAEIAKHSPATSPAVADSLRLSKSGSTTVLVPAARWRPQLAAAIEQGRQRRVPVSLLLIQIDHFDNALFLFGPNQANRLMRQVEVATAALCSNGGQWSSAGEARLAVWWLDSDRSQVVQAGRELIASLQDRLVAIPELMSANVAFSVGVATLSSPTRNFPPTTLIDAAERCLSAAHASGGNCVKSIEV